MIDARCGPFGVILFMPKHRTGNDSGDGRNNTAGDKRKVQAPASRRIGRDVMMNRTGGEGEHRIMSLTFSEIGLADQGINSTDRVTH
ncbi:MAG: hypothetical protein EOO77_05445, partial [Oxalobacteraceae bacterium]